MPAKKKRASKSKGDSGLGSVFTGATAAAAAGAYYFYGPNGKRHRKLLKGWSVKAKGELLQRVERLPEVNAKDYYDIVDKIARKYAKLKEVNSKELAEFKRELKTHWRTLERKTKSGVSKGRRKIHAATAPKKTVKRKTTKRRKPTSRKRITKKRR